MPELSQASHDDAAAAPSAGPAETSGILVVDKPIGYTSHDVVAHVRRLAGQRRVGHAGTLDPLATGVLVVLLGQATRLAEYLTRHDKAYRAIVRLGQATDTDDAEGRVISRSDAPLPALPAIEAALAAFRGAIEQTPPAYSAIKVQGEPLHRKARRGETVQPAPRTVTIHRLDVKAWEPPDLTLEVECSAGTYVRSIARDLGASLGCGAFLAGLVRTRSGPFELAMAFTLTPDPSPKGRGERTCPPSAVAGEVVPSPPSPFGGGAGGEGAWRQHLLPLDAGLGDMERLDLNAEETARIVQGQPLAGQPPQRSPLARAYNLAGTLLAIVEYDQAAGIWRPHKVFSYSRD